MFIGRDDELARVDELLHAARKGRSGALVVHGEAGMGKSALLAETVEGAAGFRVLRPAA